MADVKVKALEWEDDIIAQTPFGAYTVADTVDDEWEWTYHRYPFGEPDETKHPTKDAAKAAAQSDFERRILSALTPSQPSPERP